MIDKLAGLPTQIRQLEKRLKEMDASKVKPALVKEITDTIQNLKNLLKEKMDKREERKKIKEEKVKEQAVAPIEVEKEAIAVPNAADVGAVSQNAPAPAAAPGAPAATPDDQKVSCPLCGGLEFNDNASYQQHMAYTHASDIMPTSPGQKQDKLVASTEPAEAALQKTIPFKLDDVVKPIRGGDSKGKVMRWDGKPSDLVYVAWESGPLADRDGFGGYYPHDLELFQEEPVEAAMPMEKPACADCVSMKEKQGDLKTNYEGLLKDLKDERDIHYTQGNSKWVERLDQKIRDLEKSIEEKFPKEAASVCPTCGEPHKSDIIKDNLPAGVEVVDLPVEKHNPADMLGVPKKESAKDICNCGHGGQEHSTSGICTKCDKCTNFKEGGAQNAKELTLMDHTPPRANTSGDEIGRDTYDEMQDEWAEPQR